MKPTILKTLCLLLAGAALSIPSMAKAAAPSTPLGASSKPNIVLILADNFGYGEDTGTPVTEDYHPPFKFTGGLKQAVIDLSPANLSAEDDAKLKAGEAAILGDD